jgi:acyl transferase domain-containing protein
MTRKAALVVAPGRGTYNRDDLGYLGRHHAGRTDLISAFDAERRVQGQEAISALDGAGQYSVARFTRGDNASGLIYACSYADFLDIDRDRFEVVAVTGNSMGWYTALACAGALSAGDGFKVVNTMGTLMQEALIGGQLLYPFVDEDWREIPGKRNALLALIDNIPGLHLSINLGGTIVFGGTAAALACLEERLPPAQGRFPMRLANHAAFHTRLQTPVSARGKAALPAGCFAQPNHPLIDGRGHIWLPNATDIQALWEYTLGNQVVEPYDFTAAIRTGVREFAPDVVIILGPGATLGGAVAQSLIAVNWRSLHSKHEFTQTDDSLVLSMGMEAQRAMTVREGPRINKETRQ